MRNQGQLKSKANALGGEKEGLLCQSGCCVQTQKVEGNK